MSEEEAGNGSTKPRYVDYLSDLPDRILFFGAFLFGAAGIVLVKSSDGAQVVATAIPISLMLAYAAYASWARRAGSRDRLRQDVAGDNLYYLGFLFTLVSLSYALYDYSDANYGARGIINNFGIALWTTLAGLAMRVYFAQMRDDVLEVEQQARMDLSEAVRRLKAETDTATVEFGQLRRTVQQVALETIGGANTEVQKLAGSFARMAEDIVKKVDAAVAVTVANGEKVAASSERIAIATSELAAKISEIDAGPDLLKRTLAPRLELAVENFTQFTSASQGVVGQATQALVEETAKARTALNREQARLADSVSSFAGACEMVGLETTRAAETLSTGVQTIETFESAVDQAAATLRDLSATASAAERSAGLLDAEAGRAETALSSLRGLVERVGRTEEEVNASASRIRDIELRAEDTARAAAALASGYSAATPLSLGIADSSGQEAPRTATPAVSPSRPAPNSPEAGRGPGSARSSNLSRWPWRRG